ncbi:MAG TPA: DUF4136 domain-containing protein [Polyangia bacterium]
MKSERVAGESVAQYRTYAWAGAGATVDALVDQRIRDRVATELARRGMAPAVAGQAPDFLVEYRMETGPLYQTVVNVGPAPAPAASGGSYVAPLPIASTYTYDEAEVTLDFIDARSGRVFWRGFAGYATDWPAEASTAKAAQAVGKMMRKFPSSLASAARPAG